MDPLIAAITGGLIVTAVYFASLPFVIAQLRRDSVSLDESKIDHIVKSYLKGIRERKKP